MAVVISLGIAVVVVAFVAAPFFLLTSRSSEGTGMEPVGADGLRDLLSE
jgi:lipopolysaccharide export LptBFGC system permease protein LptF